MTTDKATMPELKPKEGFEYMIVSFPDKGLTIDGAIDIESGSKIIDIVLKAECDREYTRTLSPDKIVIDREKNDITIVEKPTCYSVHVDGLCVANFAGPDSEEHAGLFASALIAAQESVDVEALKAEVWKLNCEKYHNVQGDVRATTIVEVIDHLAATGRFK